MSANTVRGIYRRLYKAYGPQHWWPADTAFEMCVGAILTQNTAWRNVERAIAALKRAGLLDPPAMASADPDLLAETIRPAGTFRVKARRLRAFLDYLHARHNGDLNRMFATDPARLREELLAVPGIGPETADSMLLYGGHKPSFVVDAYTRRILRRHLLLAGDEPYEEIRAMFQARLPKEVPVYQEYHALLVALAKAHCRRRPDCEGCPLADLPHVE